MSDTIKIKVYEYTELNDRAKEKVRIRLDDWQFDTYDREWWTEELEKLGYADVDMSYSGFWSQGDGASIACAVNVEQFIKRNKLGKRYQSLLYWIRKVYGEGGSIQIKRERWGHYVHEKLLYADANELSDWIYEYNESEKLQTQITELEEMILEEVQEKSRELYTWLESDYEYHQTEEYMSDMCETNGYRFDMYGNPVHHLEIRE